MTRGRKPDPNQLQLRQDPSFLQFEDDERRITRVNYHHVAAWCELNAIELPTASSWGYVQRVLSFLNFCAHHPKEGDPDAAQIGRGCTAAAPKKKKMSERTTQRALRTAHDLGVLFSADQGPAASSRVILYQRLQEMLAADTATAPMQAATQLRQMPCQTEASECSDWRDMNSILAGHEYESGGAAPYPEVNVKSKQPTSGAFASSEIDWPAVVGEVVLCGVKQAQPAVDEARKRGATPRDVLEVVTYWRLHTEGWTDPCAVLCWRLGNFTAGQPAGEGWPKFSDEYQRKFDRAAGLATAAERSQRWLVGAARAANERALNQAELAQRREERRSSPSTVERAAELAQAGELEPDFARALRRHLRRAGDDELAGDVPLRPP